MLQTSIPVKMFFARFAGKICFPIFCSLYLFFISTLSGIQLTTPTPQGKEFNLEDILLCAAVPFVKVRGINCFFLSK
jgi:hypothetical protein